MKRDLDLVRRILLAMEAYPHGFALPGFAIPGYDPDVIGHHVYLMNQGQLITAAEVASYGDASPVSVPLTITWAGHEWLDAVRNDTVWLTLKADLKDKGLTLPFSLLQTLALKIGSKLAGLD